MDLLSITELTSVVLTDYFAVIVGVVMGAFYGARSGLDIVGAVATALLTGFGGGFMRDLLLHDHGIFFMEHPYLILVCVFIAAAAWHAGRRLQKMERILVPLDALSMALFALAGCVKAWDAAVGGIYTVVLGMLTSVGGGALASIAIAQRPTIFTSSYYYAVAGLGGSLAYVIFRMAGADDLLAGLVCVSVCLVLRWVSLRFNLNTKGPAGK